MNPISLVKFGLVIDIQRDDHKFLREQFKYAGIAPDTRFHLATVDTSVSGHIHKHRFATGLSRSKSFFYSKIAIKTKRQMETIFLTIQRNRAFVFPIARG